VSGEVVELTDDAAVAAATADGHGTARPHRHPGQQRRHHRRQRPTWELDPAVWRQRVIEVNLIAPYLTCRHVTPQMIAKQGYGPHRQHRVGGRQGRQPQCQRTTAPARRA
jgi:NAD(P)-dependent dehydrogenase (short-subunit alcohol dehydrogenase family)